MTQHNSDAHNSEIELAVQAAQIAQQRASHIAVSAPQPGILAWGRYLPCDLAIWRDEPFYTPGRRAFISQVAAHESVTHDPEVVELPQFVEGQVVVEDDVTEQLLRRKNLGVHFAIGFVDAQTPLVTQHNDLRDVLYHTGRPVNALSVGVEIINPYYQPRGPWKESIRAPWAHRGRYTLPLPCQVEALWRLWDALRDISRAHPGRRFCIEDRIWGVSQRGNYQFGPVAKSLSRRTPGLLAHHHYGYHADGAFPVCYCALRDRGLTAQDAYQAAVHMAASTRRSRAPLPDAQPAVAVGGAA